MSVKPVVEGLYRLPGLVNLYLLDAPEGLVLIDTGYPGGEKTVLAALQTLGRAPGDLRHVILTHAHVDHLGGLAAIVRATGARTWMHAADRPLAESGGPFRPMTAAPGLFYKLLFAALFDPTKRVEPARIDETVAEGNVLPFAGGVRVVEVPGHCAGQVALLWRRVLIAADACTNLGGLGPPIGYEDRAAGEASQRKLAGLDFDVACFGHGPPIRAGAAARFRKVFR
jgi:glyoxylase-like metal-dependent hydrolase (beta-lactamase superfamily II)